MLESNDERRRFSLPKSLVSNFFNNKIFMSIKSQVRILTFLVVILLPLTLSASNWGHWRGPDGNSASPDANPPTTWSESENVKWKVPIPGSGTGSPVVWDERVFVVTAVPVNAKDAAAAEPKTNSFGATTGELPELEFKLLCFDRQTGDQLWDVTSVVAKPHEGTHKTHGYASASPCTDGKHVYAHFGSRGIYCYTMDGKLVWKRDDLGKMSIRFTFGEGSSPTLADDKLLIPWDHQGDSFILALDKSTGDNRLGDSTRRADQLGHAVRC